MMFEFADEVERLTDIRVAGVGGGGGNAIGRMIEAGLVGVEFMALNTDLQALQDCKAHHCMQLGAELTAGRGAGGNPAVGQAAAEEDRETIAKALGGANMVFVTAGMGGGTGTGAAPVVAEVAKEQGALTVGIVTRPFLFEGRVRLQQADDGIARLREAVDTLIVVPNQRLLEVVPPNTSMQEAYRIADNVLYEATRGIFEIISRHDDMNLDFADVCAVMRGMGQAMMGTGRAKGENRALEAAKQAIRSPLLEDLDIAGSKAVLVNLLGRTVDLQDTAMAMQHIQEAAGPQAHVIFGYGIDESLEDTLQVTVIATGFNKDEAPVQESPVTAVAQPVSQAAAEPAPVSEPEAEPVAEAEPEQLVQPEQPAQPEHPAQIEHPAGAEFRTEAETEPELVAEREPEAGPMPEAAVVADEPETAPQTALPWQDQEDPVASPLADPAFWAAPAPEPDFFDMDPEIDHEESPRNDQPVDDHSQLDEPAPELTAQPPIVAGEIPDGRTTAECEDPEPTEEEALQPPREQGAEPPREGFLMREAAAGGKDRTTTAGNFLRPAGRRNIAEVEVPDGADDPVRISRAEASGLGPDNPGDDRNIPAYIRKYMD